MAGRLTLHLPRGCRDGLDIIEFLRSAISGDSIPLTASSHGPLSNPFEPRSRHGGSNPLASDALVGASDPVVVGSRSSHCVLGLGRGVVRGCFVGSRTTACTRAAHSTSMIFFHPLGAAG